MKNHMKTFYTNIWLHQNLRVLDSIKKMVLLEFMIELDI